MTAELSEYAFLSSAVPLFAAKNYPAVTGCRVEGMLLLTITI